MRFIPLVIWLLTLSAMPVATVCAADDIRVLIDVSGSMVKTDPNNLRAPALRMLNGLIPSGARAGVWTFGRYVNMEVKWGTVNDKWRKQADKGAANIHSRGQFTNIESALMRASSSWKGTDPKTNRNIILLTDGKVDISKNKDKNDHSREEIVSKRIPELISKGVKVHAVALSGNTDEDLLKRLAVETSGSFEIAENASDLQRIFLRMFERAAKPDSVPLQGNEFSIDNSIKEMTLLVFRKSGKKILLMQPDKTVHSDKKHADNVRWRDDQGYALITVTKPQAGRWTLEADVDEDNRVMIVTDLKLVVNDLPAYANPDQSLDFHVELHDNGNKISKNSFLKFVDFDIRHKFGETSVQLGLTPKDSRDVADKGIYLQKLAGPLGEGTHEFEVTADARTFDRARRFIVEVQWPVEALASPLDEPGHYRLEVKPRDAHMKPGSLRVSVSLKKPDGMQSPLPMLIEDNLWRGEIVANEQMGEHIIGIEFQGETAAGESFSHAMELRVDGVIPPPPIINEQVAEGDDDDMIEGDNDSGDGAQDSDNLVMTLVVIGIANLVFVLIGVGLFLYMRKMKQADEALLLEDTVGEVEDD